MTWWVRLLFALSLAFVGYIAVISLWEIRHAQRWKGVLCPHVCPKWCLKYEFLPWFFWRRWKAATVEQAILRSGDEAFPGDLEWHRRGLPGDPARSP